MKIISKTNWISIILNFFLIIFGFGFMFFIARINLTREENLPLGGLVFVWLLVTFAISTGLLSFYLLKKITIDENKITLKFLFSRKEFCYRFHEIEGYNLLENLLFIGVLSNFKIKNIQEN